MKNIVTCLLFMLYPYFSLFANGGSFEEGNIGTGQLQIKDSKNISIENEILYIDLHRGYAHVSVEYLMKNHGEETDIIIGFPSLIIKDNQNEAPKQEIDDYSIFVKRNGFFQDKQKVDSIYQISKMKYKWENIPENHVRIDEYGNKKENPLVGFHFSKIHFRENEEMHIYISYFSNYQFEQDFSSMWARNSKSIFRYLLSFGSTWKGPIRKGIVTINTENIQNSIAIKSDKIFSKKKNLYIWEFKNLEPEIKDDISITINNSFKKKWVPRDFDNNAVIYTLENNLKYYTVKPKNVYATSYLNNYKPKNILDNDLTTAWIVQNDQNGINESISFKFYKKTKINMIGIVAGYNKSKNIYYDNNRVSVIEIYSNERLIQSARIPDGYTSYKYFRDPRTYANIYHSFYSYYFINLNENLEKIDNLEIKIKDIYHGLKYDDTCISEIIFLEKLL